MLKGQGLAQVGMVGINVPIPVPLPFFSFTGWRGSFQRRPAHVRQGRPPVLHPGELWLAGLTCRVAPLCTLTLSNS